VVQRVKRSSVAIDGRMKAQIGSGLNVLLGISEDDNESDAEYLADKIIRIRLFPDEKGRMNLSVRDVKGELIVVSQFTLYGDCRKGNRPSFRKSAKPEKAEKLYDYFIGYIKSKYGMDAKTGKFGAMMDVMIENDGPVTLILESP
jgi:D-tyrosyl-tRNA(Tyr) deacylase